MASILDKYGIKEVADLYFYHINDGKPDYPVLYIDTAKVSTIEQTADETTANGGKGNVALISWDFNKDINVTLEDALFSMKSLAIMFGNGKTYALGDDENYGLIMKSEIFRATSKTAVAESAGWNPKFEGPNGKEYEKINPKFYTENGEEVVGSFTTGSKYFCSYDLAATGSAIRITANSFPGTYYVVGDTWARPQDGGDDEFFQFILPKAKVKAENTITLEADGDPSVFNMDLHVLRPETGDMMKLVKYDLVGGDEVAEPQIDIYHNHILTPDNMSEVETELEP